MFERFTARSRRVIVLAQEEARLQRRAYVGTEHLLLGLLRDPESGAARVLESLNVSLDAAREQVRQIVGEGSDPRPGHIPFTPRAKKVLELSLREALTLRSQSIETVHLLLGLVAEGEGVGAQVLSHLGAQLAAVRERATAAAAAGAEPDPAAGLAETAATGFPSPAGRVRVEGLRPIHELLTTIDNRLSRIEAHLGIAADPAGHDAEPGEPAAGAQQTPAEPGESSGTS